MKQLFRPSVLALAALATLAACGGGSGESAGDSTQAAESTAPAAPAPAGDTAAAGGMAGMHGMAGTEGGAMMEQMRSHMQMMNGVRGDSLKGMLPSHRQMTANMLAQFNREMQQMNMTPDPAEAALADSVRQDLRTMAEMSESELQAAMPGHHDRVTRLMADHGQMMGDGSGMKM